MKYKLIIRPEAENELEEGFAWYEERMPGLGSAFLLGIDAVINSVIRHPLQYPIVHRNVRRAMPRRFPFQVLFIVDNEVISILAIFHGKRNPRRWQDRN